MYETKRPFMLLVPKVLFDGVQKNGAVPPIIVKTCVSLVLIVALAGLTEKATVAGTLVTVVAPAPAL